LAPEPLEAMIPVIALAKSRTESALVNAYPWFGDLDFDPQREVGLACDGCVPLLWMCLFSVADLSGQRGNLGRGQG
jgi:hypothetical protein